jgi:hypothetical protein
MREINLAPRVLSRATCPASQGSDTTIFCNVMVMARARGHVVRLRAYFTRLGVTPATLC